MAPVLLFVGLGSLVLVWLVDWLFTLAAQRPTLAIAGWFSLALMSLAAASLAWREWQALQHLRQVGAIRRALREAPTAESATTLLSPVARDLVERKVSAERDSAEWRRNIASCRAASDVVGAFERGLLSRADKQAEAAIARAARGAGGFVMLSPSAVGDFLGFSVRAIVLLREIAYLYGLRPGRATEFVLLRRILFDGTLVGAADLGTDVASGAIGRVLGTLSGTAAQGTLAVYRMTRIGILLLAECRPVPLGDTYTPSLTDIARRAMLFGDARADAAEAAPNAAR